MTRLVGPHGDTDLREQHSAASVDQLWEVVESIGGENGWYSFPLAWAVRGWLDKLVGGVGLRRGRRDARRLEPGDALDFWRVEDIDRGHFLRLRAEMKVPGRAWLEMTTEADPQGGSTYRQRAVFFPSGLGGRLYRLNTKFAGYTVTEADLEAKLAPAEPAPSATGGRLSTARAELASGRTFSLEAALRAVQATYLDATIEAAQGNMSQAARLLGISRSTLYSRLEAAGRAGAKLPASDAAEPADTPAPRN